MADSVPVLLMVRNLDLGGCERDLTRAAKALDRSRFQPHVGCFHTGGLRYEELIEAGIPVVPFPVRSLIGASGWSGAIALRRYASRNRIGLIHTFDAPTSVFATLVARWMGVPVIVSNLWYRNTMQNRLYYALRAIDRVAHAIVVNSKAVRQDLVQHEKTPAQKIHLCYNGVDTTVFRPVTPAERSQREDSPLVIGCVCVLRAEKRLDRLLEAFAALRASHRKVNLLIVGNGEMLPRLDEMSRRLGIAGVCTFEPAQKDVADWMRRIDIFVLPSETESFPNALLEAMACGCAVVGSRVGGIPELIEDGQSGLLFDGEKPGSLESALRTLIEDATLRKRLAQVAVERANSCFSLERSLRCIEDLYETVLEGERGRRKV